MSKSDLVFRVRSKTFHLDCLRCAVCERPLQPGEEIAFQNDQMCCSFHTTSMRRGRGQVSDEAIKCETKPAIETSTTTLTDAKWKLPDRNLEFQPKLLDISQGPVLTTKNCNFLPSLLAGSVDVNMEQIKREQLEGSQPRDENQDDKLATNKDVSTTMNTMPTDLGICTSGNDVTAAEFPEPFVSSPPYRPNSAGSSLGIMLRDTGKSMFLVLMINILET